MPLFGERKRQYMKQYRLDHLEKMRARDRFHYIKRKPKMQAYRKKMGLAIKQEVLSHYGNGSMKCTICGELRVPCLSLDHINGEGTKHRKELGLWGTKFYSWLKKEGFPEGYQTLCMNCQWMKYYDAKEKGEL